MTAKQFIDIILFFMRKISGKEISSNETDILSFIQSLSYPSTEQKIKSCLRTPAAPHSYNECILLLAWLNDIARYTHVDTEIETPFECDDEFPNVEYTKEFSDEVRRAFPLWNKADDEFNKIKERLIEKKIILTKKCFQNVEDLNRRTEELKLKNRNMNSDVGGDYNDDPEKIIKKIGTELKEAELELERNIKWHSSLTAEYESISIKHKDIEKKNAVKIAKLQKIINDVQCQKYTSVELHQQIAYESSLRESKAIIENKLFTMRNNSNRILTQIARLKKLRDDSVVKLDILLESINKTMRKSSEQLEINVKRLRIDPKKTAQNIYDVISEMNRLYDAAHVIKQNYVKQIESQQTQHEQLTSEYKCLGNKCIELSNNLREMNKDHIHINIEVMKIENETKDVVMKCEQNTKEATTTKQQLNSELARNRTKIDDLRAINAQQFVAGEQQIIDNIRKKESHGKQLDELINFIDEFSENIDIFH